MASEQPTSTSDPAHIEVDTTEQDSALGDDDLSAYTQSLQSSLLQGSKEHGRQYHAYGSQNKYLLPEDEDEQDRLDLQHSALVRLFNGKLLLAPAPEDAHNVLDMGTGTGIWAVEYADQHPEAEIIGTDLSPIQPTTIPPNCKFMVDDYEKDWLFDRKFDIIHGRLLNTTMAEPQATFKKAFEALNPGGWFEIQDMTLPTLCDDDSIPKDSAYQRWMDLSLKAVKAVARDWGWPNQYKAWLEEVGFEGVTEVRLKWPQNPWPKDKQLKLLGQINMVNTLLGLEGFTYRPFCGFLGMSKEEVDVLLADMRKDIKDTKIHAYWPILVVYGQKPKAPQ